MCSKVIEEPGGLLFSPPKKCHESEMFETDIVRKYHLCSGCFDDTITYIDSMKLINQ